MDSYQPESLPFSQHYSETSPSFDDREEIDDGDIVKSKLGPRGKMNSYLPLVNVNDAPSLGESRASATSSGVCGYQGQFGPPERGAAESIAPSLSKNQGLPPNGIIPVVEPVHPHLELTPAPSQASELAPLGSDHPAGLVGRDSPPGPPTKTGKGLNLEDSTTDLLRRYTMERNGRPTSIHFGPSGEIVGSGWLSEILVTGHKKCAVTLEEDAINWRFLSRKEGTL